MAQAQAADRRSNKNEKKDELVEKLVHINRVAKTVKGGRNMSFAAVVVVGDQKGRVGYGSGKATEVPDAITKATNEAKKNMVRIPLREGRTLHHDVAGRFGAGKVVLRTAPAGTGVIAGGPMRAIFEVLGVPVVVTGDVLAEILAQLPEGKRDIILLSFFLEMTDREIAEYLHIVHQTVSKRRIGILKELRKILEKEGYEWPEL